MVYATGCWKVHMTDLKEPRSEHTTAFPLYNSQGEETVFVETGSGGNLNKVHGLHGFSGSNLTEDILGQWYLVNAINYLVEQYETYL